MRLVAPLALALAGLGAGVAAGVALRPAPEAAPPPCPETECPPDPLAPPPPEAAHAPEGETSIVAVDKPFVVPVFEGERVRAMIVASVAVSLAAAHETRVEALTPPLRDALLAAMFRHANSGGFDGAFTTGRKMDDLRAALLAAARQIFAPTPVSDVLITEIARQDM